MLKSLIDYAKYKDFQYFENCRLCCGKIVKVIDMNNSPPANALCKTQKDDRALYPLNIFQCQNCGHHQLEGEVNINKVFDKYLYLSGTSSVNRKHFEDYANKLINDFQLKETSFVCEIGSNDGTMLSFFKDKGIKIIGVDPATNIAEMANKNGILTIAEYFCKSNAEYILKKYGKADCIVANNVLAHSSQLDAIIDGINILLKEDGYLVFEVSYFLDVLDNCLFDLNYNEHIHQHLIGPLINFLSKHSLYLYDVEKIPNHGGSIRVYVSKSFKMKTKRCLNYWSAEKNINEKITKFIESKKIICNKINSEVEKIKLQGKSVAAFGFPAKATTFLHELNIAKYIDFIVDDNILKQNLYSPGHHIPIYHPDEIYKKNPNYIIIFAWNFAQSIIDNYKNYQGIWIIPSPEYKEIKNYEKKEL